jgi:beta-mannosidase
MTLRVPLSDGWSLHLDADPHGVVPAAVREALPIPATVPGTVHTDLLAAGLIPDPYLDRNELDLAWIGLAAWRYECSFDTAAEPGTETDLAFDGLDTIATVELNGIELARTRNMHRRYRIRATEAVQTGSNWIVVRFASAVDEGEAERARIGEMPSQYPGPFNYLRKMACNFGWDWGPVLVTAGIWRPVAVESWRVARLADVRPAVTVEGTTGVARIAVALAAPAPHPLVVRATVGDAEGRTAVPAGATDAVVRVEVPGVALWSPRGFGAPTLYDLAVTVSDDAGEHDGWATRIGFRTVELDTSPDDDGSRFELRVNGVLLPVRGANWIPDDCFPSRVTEERLRTRIGQAIDAGINLLRVWGGGTYESEDFYRICDELGVAVWQDFLFACATYPEVEPIAGEVAAEARDNVARLMPHASLLLWNGNNENIWGYQDWGWQAGLEGRAWGLGYYLDVLPGIVAEVDPTRPYWPGSPYSGSPELHPNLPGHGTVHLWTVWNETDYVHYRDVRPRFVAEFGWQAPATWATIRRSVSDEPLAPDSPAMLHHQKASDGQGKLTRGLAHHLSEPASFDDWLLATQVVQARAFATGIASFRSQRPRCTGSILWQLNDCWPVTSWALVDGDGRRKPAWYAVREVNSENLLTIQPGDDGLEIVAVTDAPRSWAPDVRVRRISFDGAVLAESRLTLRADAVGAARAVIDSAVTAAGDPARELIVAEAPGSRALWFFAEDRDLGFADGLEAVARRVSDGSVELLVRAGSLVKDLCIAPDRIDPAAQTDEGLLTLLPGEERTVRVTGIPAGREDELTHAPVLRSIGDVVRAAAAAEAR